MKINGELGKVLSTSPEHKQWNCGRDTTTGAAELAQIPAAWGGTGE